MKIFNQLGIILGIWAVGELISSLLSNIITMPGTIIGMIILFLLLQFKIMKEETIKEKKEVKEVKEVKEKKTSPKKEKQLTMSDFFEEFKI